MDLIVNIYVNKSRKYIVAPDISTHDQIAMKA